MGRLLVVAAALICFTQSQANDRSNEDFWRGVNLPFKLFSDAVSNDVCYQQFKFFHACIHASNTMLALKNAKLAVRGEETLPGHGKVLEDWGRVKLVERTAPAESGNKNRSLLEFITKVKTDREVFQQNLKAVWHHSEDRFDFSKVVSFIETQVLVVPESRSAQIAEGLNAFLEVADDPHTRIAPTAQFEHDRKQSEKALSGIGVSLRNLDGELVVVAPVEGGPAHRAGVKAQDVVTHVDGTLLKGKTLQESRALMMGPEGSQVNLTLRRADKVVEVKVVREKIVVKNVSHKMLSDDRKKLGYLKIGDFMQHDVGNSVREAARQLKKDGAEALILDLRGNPGGLLDQAVEVANVFLPKDQVVVSIRDIKSGGEQALRTSQDAEWDSPVVTLVDSGSASASEIVSGALQDHRRGLILGERSFGKGTAQTVRPYSKADGVHMIRTKSTFHLPSGRSNQILGVIPDIEAFTKPNPSEEDKFAVREEDLYSNALPASSEKFVTLQPELVASVKECLAREGKALVRLEAGKTEAIIPDYQLLLAQDALVCQRP